MRSCEGNFDVEDPELLTIISNDSDLCRPDSLVDPEFSGYGLISSGNALVGASGLEPLTPTASR